MDVDVQGVWGSGSEIESPGFPKLKPGFFFRYRATEALIPAGLKLDTGLSFHRGKPKATPFTQKGVPPGLNEAFQRDSKTAHGRLKPQPDNQRKLQPRRGNMEG